MIIDNDFDEKVLEFPSYGRIVEDDEEPFNDKINDLYERESLYVRKLEKVHEEMREGYLQYHPKKYKYFIRFFYRVESIDKQVNGVYEQILYAETKPKNVKRFCKQYLKECRDRLYPGWIKVRFIKIVKHFYIEL